VRRDLDVLAAREHDLLIVGGGIYGAASAWDAAQRGLRVALVERDDFGAGVSWNSLKTIHGGLRYLQKADLARMRESIRERRALLRIAPALVRPLPFLVPTSGHGLAGPEALRIALAFNDLISHDRNDGLPATHHIPRGRMLSRDEVLGRLPGVAAHGLNGGGLWTDAQVASSERLGVAFVHAAAEAGALVANHVEALGFLKAGGRVTGIRARDVLAGEDLPIRARLVLNAAGPGVDALLAEGGIHRAPTPLLKAWNLVFARPPVVPFAVGARTAGRFLFMVPWRDRSIVGTAYAPPETRSDEAVAAFRDEAVRAFPWARLDDVPLALVHEGLVPGHGGPSGLATRPRLHDHETEDGVAGLVSIQGVKYTTARAVAEKAVDLGLRRLGRPPNPCRTAVTPLPRARPLEGTLAARTLEAVREEMALTLSDVVLRRLDLGTAGPPSEADLETVTRTMATHLGWDSARVGAERAALAKRFPPA
jgi:glycerol-3-phosphate dehydrogenase